MYSKNSLVSVSDIVSWLYCPRKLYLNKVCGLETRLNRSMLIGRLKHSILENFSKNEERLISQIDKNFENLDIVFLYENYLRKIAFNILSENSRLVEGFMIDKESIIKKILQDFSEDIKIRVKSIRDALSKGFSKENLWKNLDCIYFSELKLESETLGLKGRVDRVAILKKDNSLVPYELKSREDKIFFSDEIQITAYAMLLEHHYRQAVKRGIIETGNKKHEIEITEKNKNEVLRIADEIRKLKNGFIPPIQSNFNKCRTCEFYEECMKL